MDTVEYESAGVARLALMMCTMIALAFLSAAKPALAEESTPRAQKYKVTATMVHLGEVVAAPVMVVEEGTTTRIHQGEPPNYTVGVLIQSSDGDEVQISLDYSSGNLSAQPNLVVPIGEPYQTSTEKMVLHLQVDLYED